MESKHLVGGLGMTTTGEQVTVIVYPYRLPKRLKPLTECILEAQKNFGKAAVGTVLLLCIDPKAKFELVSRNGLRVVIVPPNHPLFRETLETMPRLYGFVHLVYAALHDLASGVAPTKVFRLCCQPAPERLPRVEQGHRERGRRSPVVHHRRVVHRPQILSPVRCFC